MQGIAAATSMESRRGSTIDLLAWYARLTALAVMSFTTNLKWFFALWRHDRGVQRIAGKDIVSGVAFSLGHAVDEAMLTAMHYGDRRRFADREQRRASFKETVRAARGNRTLIGVGLPGWIEQGAIDRQVLFRYRLKHFDRRI